MKKILISVLVVLVLALLGWLSYLYYCNRIPENALVYYRIKDYKGDISVWLGSNCQMDGDKFECHAKACPDEKAMHYYPRRKEGLDTTHYEDIVTIDFNFGLFKKTGYIPFPDYGEFNENSAREKFAVVDNVFLQETSFKTRYELSAVGLPGNVLFYEMRDGEYVDSLIPIKKDSLISEMKRRNPLGLGLLHGGLTRMRSFPHYTCYCANYPTYCGNPKFTHLPVMAEYRYYYIRAIGTPDTTVVWKLIYKTPYTNADTLDITTEFKKQYIPSKGKSLF